MNYIKGTRDFVSMRENTLGENLQSLRVNRHSNDQEPSNSVDIKHDKRQKESGKQSVNTRMGEVINNFIFISLVKYTLQSFEGQKKREEEKRRDEVTENSLFISLAKCTLQSLKKK